MKKPIVKCMVGLILCLSLFFLSLTSVFAQEFSGAVGAAEYLADFSANMEKAEAKGVLTHAGNVRIVLQGFARDNTEQDRSIHADESNAASPASVTASIVPPPGSYFYQVNVTLTFTQGGQTKTVTGVWTQWNDHIILQ